MCEPGRIRLLRVSIGLQYPIRSVGNNDGNTVGLRTASQLWYCRDYLRAGYEGCLMRNLMRAHAGTVPGCRQGV